MVVFGVKTFGKWLDYEGWALMSEISVLKKRNPETSLTPSAIWGDSEKTAYEPKVVPKHESATTSILDLPASRTVTNTFLMFKALSLWYFY